MAEEAKKKGSWLWPKFETEADIKSATNGSAGVALFIVASYTIITAIEYFSGSSVYSGDYADEYEFIGAMIANVIAILLGLLLAYRLWKRGGRIATTILFIWVTFEVLAKISLTGRASGLVLGVLLIIYALAGMRAAYARKNLLSSTQQRSVWQS